MQGSQAQQNTALQEVQKLQQQAALHLRGLQILIDNSSAQAAVDAEDGSCVVLQFAGLDVRQEISTLQDHLLSSLLIPAAHSALRYCQDAT